MEAMPTPTRKPRTQVPDSWAKIWGISTLLEPQIRIEQSYELLTGKAFIYDNLLAYLVRNYDLGPLEAEAQSPHQVLALLRGELEARQASPHVASPLVTTPTATIPTAKPAEYLGIRLGSDPREIERDGYAKVVYLEDSPLPWRLLQLQIGAGITGAGVEIIKAHVWRSEDRRKKENGAVVDRDVHQLVSNVNKLIFDLGLTVENGRGKYTLQNLKSV
jgi:hypothetical protein